MVESLHGTPPERQFAEHEHREVLRGLDHIHEAGAAAMMETAEQLALALLDVLHWIDTVLSPHAEWEDRWLYPEIDRLAGTPWATKLMSFEHTQILKAAQLIRTDRDVLHREVGREHAVDARAHLYALETLVRAHIEREERFLIPLLDHLTEPRVPVLADAGG